MEVDRSFFSHFLRLQHTFDLAYAAAVTEAAQGCGLTKPEADVLLFLANNPQFNTARDVAQYRGMSRAYVSHAVEGLSEKGMLSTFQSSEDRRYQTLRLRATAQTRVDILRAAQKQFFDTVLNGVPVPDRQELTEMMNGLEANLAAMCGQE